MSEPKLCIKCKHFRANTYNIHDLARCLLGCEVSLVDGLTGTARPEDSQFCQVRRMRGQKCGPDGLEWEPAK